MPELDDLLAGLDKGSRVVIRQSGSAVLAELLLACLDAGLVAVPVHPGADDRAVDELARRVSASLIVRGGPGRQPEVTELPGCPDHPEAAGLALIMFTSGSTGRPKGVKLSRRAVLGNARKTAQLHGITPDRPHGTCLPLFHCNALVMSLYGTHLTDSPLVLHEWSDPAAYFAALGEGGARTASIVPALLCDLVEAGPAWPESLDYLITAAAPLSREVAARFHRLYGPRIRQGFGLTESVNFSTLMPLLDATSFTREYVDQFPPVGVAVPETEIRIEDGEVWLRSPDLMDGYWEDPETTSRTLTADGWLRSGDLGELRDGYLVLHGRRAEMINRGGEKYYPGDLEEKWRQAGTAVPVSEPSLGQEIGLVLAGQDIETVRPLLSGGGIRPAVVQSGGLAVTSTGKPQRTLMGQRLAVRRDSGRRYEELLDYAARSGQAVLSSRHHPTSPQSKQMYAQMQALVAAHTTPVGPPSFGRSAAHDALDALVSAWPAIAGGTVEGESLMREHPGLWRRLMTEWPMGDYARLMADVLESGDALRGRVLELGSGVGNTTSLIAGRVDGEFVWSDRVLKLVERGRWPGRGVVFDLDAEPPAGLGRFDTILATNVLHCVADPARTLAALHRLLADDGRIFLAEGTSPTSADGTPWALNHLFSLWGGWWDRGGFRSRWQWLSMLAAAGLRDRGLSVLRAGRHDLGGVVWARR
jgi:long-chain acyl-CoA synthetase